VSAKDLRRGIQEIRQALDVLEGKMEAQERFDEAVRDLGAAVGTVRGSAWEVLTNVHAQDLDGFLARLRVERATETCESVLADLYAETLPPSTPGLDVFGASLRELTRAWREIGQ